MSSPRCFTNIESSAGPWLCIERHATGMVQEHLGDRPRVRRRDLIDGVAGGAA